MDEIICAGTVEELAPFIQELGFEKALFLAEEFSRQVIRKQEDRKKLLWFDFLDQVPDVDRQRYTSGRIFTKQAEVRWQKKGEDTYDVVYFGPWMELKGMSKSRQQTIAENDYDHETKGYYLFGQRLRADQFELLGIPPSDRLYAEARIPRLLHYPWSQQPTSKQEWVKLEVREYREKATAQVAFYRFQDVIPAE